MGNEHCSTAAAHAREWLLDDSSTAELVAEGRRLVVVRSGGDEVTVATVQGCPVMSRRPCSSPRQRLDGWQQPRSVWSKPGGQRGRSLTADERARWGRANERRRSALLAVCDGSATYKADRTSPDGGEGGHGRRRREETLAERRAERSSLSSPRYVRLHLAP